MDVLDLVTELAVSTSKLGTKLHPSTAAHLADVVRIMNCYYSNLIEGHNTRPRDIERALNDDLEVDRDRRNLQLEARAHIRIQEAVDRSMPRARCPTPPVRTSSAGSIASSTGMPRPRCWT